MNDVELHELGFRRDRDEWIVGRVDTGDMIAVPEVGVTAIRLLQNGATVTETEQRILTDVGNRVDVAGFVDGLTSAGLVRSIAGQPVGSPPAISPTFPWLRQEHVRWALSPVLHAALLLIIGAGVVTVAARPGIVPGWRDLLWSEHGTVLLLGYTAVAWALIFAHELAHLITARAAGVPGRIGLGTRLQFLVAQTDVSGIWLAPRRARLTVYLAGMTLDAAIGAGCVIANAVTGSHPLLQVLLMETIIGIAGEFLLFMRTDIYFALQDLTGCRNLYGDATAYFRQLLARAVGRRTLDPLTKFRHNERRTVHIYTVLMVLGTVVCIALATTVTIPVACTQLVRSVTTLTGSPDLLTAADAVATIAICFGFLALWAIAWWRRHRLRVRRFLTRRADLPGTAGGSPVAGQ